MNDMYWTHSIVIETAFGVDLRKELQYIFGSCVSVFSAQMQALVLKILRSNRKYYFVKGIIVLCVLNVVESKVLKVLDH